MNILKEVLKNEVFPALGCTEPIAVALAASLAAEQTTGEITSIVIKVDPGVFKNGYAVVLPNTNGERGNLLAGVMGALIAKPDLQMEILKSADSIIIEQAKKLIKEKKAAIEYDLSKNRIYIEVTVTTDTDTCIAIIEENHTNLTSLKLNGKYLINKEARADKLTSSKEYKNKLKDLTLKDIVKIAEQMDDEDADYIRQGIKMNLEIAQSAKDLKKVSHNISSLIENGYLGDDIFSACKILVASASDARMGGVSLPVMSSGGSGNHGIVAILVPCIVGEFRKLDEVVIIRSIALSHLVNSYVKCYTGELSTLCGCAIAAGVGATVALVYQEENLNLEMMNQAVNNVISDIGGMFCDGAKSGCALKIVSTADSAIRSAHMAIKGHGVANLEGFMGDTAEKTIQNLSRISKLGMGKVDKVILDIMLEKGSLDQF